LGSGWAALVASAAYVLSPIWLSTVYTRGAFAESVLLGLLPWVLWAADRAAEDKRRRIVAAMILALLVGLCLLTQAGLALAFVLLVLVYEFARVRGRTPDAPMLYAALGLAAGVILGALASLPVVSAKGFGALGALEPAQWLILFAPWVALLAGWLAVRLAAMLPLEAHGARPALLAVLVGLVLISVYGDVQPRGAAAPTIDAPLAIFGQNEIALLSVETEGVPGPTGRVALVVEWQALAPITRDYTVFFHVVAGNDQRYGQTDTVPQGGQLPTSQWLPGQVVRDRYEAVIAPDAPIGANYRYWFGWYLGATGERLVARPAPPEPQDDKYIVRP
jgi:hypothetical protein